MTRDLCRRGHALWHGTLVNFQNHLHPDRPWLQVTQLCLSQQRRADKQQDKSSWKSENRKLMLAFLSHFLNVWISKLSFFLSSFGHNLWNIDFTLHFLPSWAQDGRNHHLIHHKESKRNKKERKSILNIVERLGTHRVKNKVKRDYGGNVSLDKKPNETRKEILTGHTQGQK